MNLRPELMPAPISEERRREVQRRIEEIFYAVDFGCDDATDLIADFNQYTGRPYTFDFFRKFGGGGEPRGVRYGSIAALS